MTPEQIQQLLADGTFPENTNKRELVETHISWVIFCGQFVYKIKKPLQYSFLDFSTPEQRKFYCEKEVVLNRRLAPDIYLEVVPIRLAQGKLIVGGTGNDIIDYAVKMRKLDRDKQMDVLLRNNKVTPQDMANLAETIAAFHKSAEIIRHKNHQDVREQFRDLETEKDTLSTQLQGRSRHLIDRALKFSEAFMTANDDLQAARLQEGFYRDCHGDLHTRNIFLLPTPQPFDCIEFNEDFRQIDVLNEVAFLCMDLDAHDRPDLGDHFLRCYNDNIPAMRTEEEEQLFVYYKSYRANVRAKVASLRARSAEDDAEKKKALSAAGKYLELMDGYIEVLDK